MGFELVGRTLMVKTQMLPSLNLSARSSPRGARTWGWATLLHQRTLVHA